MIRHMIFWDLADPNADRGELAAYQDYPPHVDFKNWAKEHFKGRCCVDLEVAE